MNGVIDSILEKKGLLIDKPRILKGVLSESLAIEYDRNYYEIFNELELLGITKNGKPQSEFIIQMIGKI